MHQTEMDLQRMQNQDVGFVLSTDVKPRLKWTPELHQRFIEAVSHLGGADKATPRSLMGVMGIPGLTLYHLKSHLQKYRLGKNQQSETCNENDQEDSTDVNCSENQVRGGHISGEIMGITHTHINESLQMAQALHMQMEVQKKLHQQIEVQRHLQLRIEAQGMYLQSILKKAQDALTGYKSEVPELVSMTDTQCPSSPISGLTETGVFCSKVIGRRSMRGTDYSMDSSLTSSESSEGKDEKLQSGDTNEHKPPLVEIAPNGSYSSNNSSTYRVPGRKRSGSTISDDTCVEKPPTKRSPPHQEKPVAQLRKFGLKEEIDLNRKYQSEMD